MAFKLPFLTRNDKGSIPAREGLPERLPDSSDEVQTDADILSASSGLAGKDFSPERDLRIPLIGHLPQQRQERILLSLLVFSFVMILVFGLAQWQRSYLTTYQVEMVGESLKQYQKISKALPGLVQGHPEAIDQLEEGQRLLNKNLDDLNQAQTGEFVGSGETYGYQVYKPDAKLIDMTLEITAIWQAPNDALTNLLTKADGLKRFSTAQGKIKEVSPAIVQLVDQIAIYTQRNNSTVQEVAAASQLRILNQRISQNLDAMVSNREATAETTQLLTRDFIASLGIVDGFMNGSESLRLAVIHEPATREKLSRLQSLLAQYQKSAEVVASTVGNLQTAKQAEQLVLANSDVVRDQLSELKNLYWQDMNTSRWPYWMMLVFVLVAMLAVAGMVVAQLQGGLINTREAEKRRREAEAQRLQAQKQEEEAKAINERNQAAILRLMNELTEVADGNLTVQATVSEDITGAIADSINYTVEELRILVGRVTKTAEQVTSASNLAQQISSVLIKASQQQSSEIQDTSQAVLKMAEDITEVSKSASQSADVARQSLAATAQGSMAVENTIKGMDEIRMQIQETAKRIKRLGESTQQIGEITELISDITEQTNVLALNAAIQAASAGEAGRGFSVVAEEVQKLAERSAAATRQIGALVRTIQTDTQDAVAAMENSTQEVVEGAKLTDAAGAALTDIGHVSNQLAELIQQISSMTEEQAKSANNVARNIQNMLGVTEQTQQGTQQTVQSIQQLNTLAEELKNSVSRFRVSS